MDTFYAVCLGVVTVSVVVAVVYIVLTLKQIIATARAIEFLAINANDRIESVRGLFDAVNIASNTIRSFWFKAMEFGLGLVSGYMGKRENR